MEKVKENAEDAIHTEELLEVMACIYVGVVCMRLVLKLDSNVMNKI